MASSSSPDALPVAWTEKNWKCRICGRVWPDIIPVIRHIKSESGGMYGDADEYPDGLWPEQVDDEPDVEMAHEGVEREFIERFEEGDGLWATLKNSDAEIPPQLTEYDMRALNVLEMARPVIADLESTVERLEETDEMLDEAFDTLMEEREQSVQPESEEEEPEEPTETPSAGGGGGYSTADIREKQEQEVETILEKLGIFDERFDDGEAALDVFMDVYEERDADTGVSPDDVAHHLGVPNHAVEEYLDGLVEMDLLIKDDRNDTFTYPAG